jgi:hypothetical protein
MVSVTSQDKILFLVDEYPYDPTGRKDGIHVMKNDGRDYSHFITLDLDDSYFVRILGNILYMTVYYKNELRKITLDSNYKIQKTEVIYRHTSWVLSRPRHLYVDPDIIAISTDNKLRVFRNDGNYGLTWEFVGASEPQGITRDDSGRYFVLNSDLKAIQVFSPDGTPAENVVEGIPEYSRGFAMTGNKTFYLSTDNWRDPRVYKFVLR